MESTKKDFKISIIYSLLFLISCVPFNIAYKMLENTHTYVFWESEIVRPISNLMKMILFYPILNFFETILHVSPVGILYPVVGTIFYFAFGYLVTLLFNKLKIKNIFVRIFLSIILLPITSLIYMPFGPRLF